MRISSINNYSTQKQSNQNINFQKKNLTEIVTKSVKAAVLPTAMFLSVMFPVSCVTQKQPVTEELRTEVINNKENNLPYYIQPESVQYSKKFEMNGKKYTMFYTDYCQKFSDRKDAVLEIYFVPDDFKLYKEGVSELNSPPKLEQFVYHKLEGERDFMSAVISESVCDSDGENYKRTIREIVLPDNIGEKLLDLYQGNTKFYMVPGVDTYVEVYTSKLMEPIIYEGKEVLTLDK